jgi:hypothetical protein
MKCPLCKEPMEWKEGLLTSDGARDVTTGRYYCRPCCVSMKMQDSRAIQEGRKKAKEFENIKWNDKRMLRLPTAVQIGILREKQKKLGGRK